MTSWRRRKLGTCPSGCTSFAYDLSVRLDEGILPFVELLGESAIPFQRTSILKIEGPDYVISGIRRLKEIRLMLKKGADEEIIERFEEALLGWLTAEQSGE